MQRVCASLHGMMVFDIELSTIPLVSVKIYIMDVTGPVTGPEGTVTGPEGIVRF